MINPAALLYSVFNKLRRDVYLRRLRRSGDGGDPRRVFGYYFEKNLFGAAESLSGTGSSLDATRSIREALPALMKRLDVRSVLDLPCGDFNWARAVDWSGVAYTGADIVPELIERNRRLYARDGIRFEVLDIFRDELPAADLVLCRDLFIHFPNAGVMTALAALQRSQSVWLLTTDYAGVRHNRDISLGSFRPLNLQRPPFGFPPPRERIPDADYLRLWDRGLSLWRMADLPHAPRPPAGTPGSEGASLPAARG